MLPFACAAPHHLFEQNARLDRAKEDDKLQVRDVNPRREHVHRHHNPRLTTVAKLADALKRSVHAPGDFLHKRIATTEDVTGQIDKLVGV